MYKTILLPIDITDSASWERTLPAAVAMARTFGAELHLLNVVPDYSMSIVGQFFPPDYEQNALDQARSELEQLAKNHVPSDIDCKRHVVFGRVYKKVMEAAGEVGADLIVIGAQDKDMSDMLLGTNAEKVVAHAEQSVLVVRG